MSEYIKMLAKGIVVIAIATAMSACATSKTVPLSIQSSPLGGHVVYQLPSSSRGASTDWIYLGKTPIDLNQPVDKRQLREAQAFRVKVFKDGFHDQIRDWSEKEIDAEVGDKGEIFWNPKLVPNGS